MVYVMHYLQTTNNHEKVNVNIGVVYEWYNYSAIVDQGFSKSAGIWMVYYDTK